MSDKEPKAILDAIAGNLGKVILGKEDRIELLLVALMAGGHVLLEDVPGVGKTTLAKALAKSIDGSFKRIQFTPDLLPSDVTGGSIYNQTEGSFSFRAGPVFANVVLADEINRASPRTQSALVGGRGEAQGTGGGTGHVLEAPLFGLATQNPVEYHGTYPLPEAQLDRFMVKLSMGYPPLEQEKGMLHSKKDYHPLEDLSAVASISEILELYARVSAVEVEDSVADYILSLVYATRDHPSVQVGASPRGSLAIYRAARSQAVLRGRAYVLPEDVKELAVSVLAHRIVLETQAKYAGVQKEVVIEEVLEKVAAPR